ncbi:hypothetical protein Syun_007226 [Stephania yunnanensis]|uniref:Isopenicillin N synthase-like Fe(2+) 2OG dioxygenase domain-containing protein n=1 Tax=Stephania yunnanensis TaxID=152371 RepID=A0AAP0PZ73_9MAGN
MEDEIDAEIIEPFKLSFSDLTLLSSYSSTIRYSLSEEEIERLDSISRGVMETLGPYGPGLLLVSPVPKAAADLRRSLLPLARKLALLSDEDRRRVLKEYSLCTDVPLKNPDRGVSSFALQLKYVKDTIAFGESNDTAKDTFEAHLGSGSLHDPSDEEFKSLEKNFRELGNCMMGVGLLLARLCDMAIGGQELEQSILESRAAKGRLIHYHSTLDNFILKEARKTKGSSKRLTNNLSTQLHGRGVSGISNLNEEAPVKNLNLVTGGNNAKSCKTSLSNLWEQWHYDYGIFTVLTVPMFISSILTEAKQGLRMSSEQECSPPDGHSYLQILHPTRKSICLVKCPPESFVVQVGESADVLSKGKLCSTLHSVCRPAKQGFVSRETFVVFLQPAWDKTFIIPETICESSIECDRYIEMEDEEIQSTAEPVSPSSEVRQSHDLTQVIHKIIPPLSSRLKNGMTFAEFSRETTKQYYGASGMQSKR